MADFLIQHLQHKAEQHSSLRLLLSQWDFDERLIPKALQTVGHLFPHYSRHDESHSKQILVNIERLLADNIVNLSATDTWLILEAAYWHDIGMVVPQKDYATALADEKFKLYLEQISNTPHHDLQRFAQNFDINNMAGCFGGADSPIDAMDKFRQLMAEWFRRSHHERANQTAQSPWENAGISSPRTELIPSRLYKLLGQICQMHGLPFKDVLTQLPYREAGLAREDCHPRFIACLLRMGDLLDLDNNRFCPVMQQIAGEQRPALSRAHEDKHHAIRHLRMDHERIEVEAECTTIDGYLETFKWFDWLKQEMQDQMAHWQDIVPDRVFGLLPTLGNLSVRLAGGMLILKDGQRPQFSINGPKAIKLLQGDNLYGDKFACIRELLQNAADATLLRLWLTEEKKYPSESWKTPVLAKAILSSAKIEVSLIALEADGNTSNNDSRWRLTITDQGTGVSKEDLLHMLCIGGSQDNLQRQNEINKMPEWMKPSGAFGIGFQSVFMIADAVKLTTKSIFSNEILEITMHSPTGKNQGLMLFKKLQNNISLPFGTTIEVTLDLPRHRGTWDHKQDTHTGKLIAQLDPIMSDGVSIAAVNLVDKIEEFSKNSLIEITGTMSGINDGEAAVINANNDVANYADGDWHFVEVNQHTLALKYELQANDHGYFETLYRGQAFKNNLAGFPGIGVEVNIMSGKAGDWLTASREKLVGSAIDQLHNTVLQGLKKIIAEELEKGSNCQMLAPEYKRHCSFFLAAMGLRFGEDWVQFPNQPVDAWLDLLVGYTSTTWRDQFQQNKWQVYGEFHHHQTHNSSSLPIIDINSMLWKIAVDQWQKIGTNTIQLTEDEIYLDYDYFSFKNCEQPYYTNEALARYLKNASKQRYLTKRYLLACKNKWEKLHLKPIRLAYTENLLPISFKNERFILLPFLFLNDDALSDASSISVTPEKLIALCKWIKPKLIADLSIEEIHDEYRELITYIDHEIMAKSRHAVAWQAARGGN